MGRNRIISRPKECRPCGIVSPGWTCPKCGADLWARWVRNNPTKAADTYRKQAARAAARAAIAAASPPPPSDDDRARALRGGPRADAAWCSSCGLRNSTETCRKCGAYLGRTTTRT